jgi:antitoxin CptB
LRPKRYIAIASSREILIKRLRHQSLKRGTSENGILLGDFSATALATLSSEELAEYEEIISENDLDLFNWLSGVQKAPNTYLQSTVFGKLAEHYKARKNPRCVK